MAGTKALWQTLTTERLQIIPLSRRTFENKRRALPQDSELRQAMDELRMRSRTDLPWKFVWYTDREIYLRDSGACVGSIACMNSPSKNPWERDYIEIGYSMDAAFQGKGYMTEAVRAVCRLILSQKGVKGMIAGVEAITSDRSACLRSAVLPLPWAFLRNLSASGSRTKRRFRRLYAPPRNALIFCSCAHKSRLYASRRTLLI